MAKVRSNDILFLKHLAEYRVLTVNQIAAVYNITTRAARKKVKTLFSETLISVMPINFGQGKGRPENLITISSAGINALFASKTLDEKVSSERLLFKDYQRIEHELLVNWVRIHLMHLEKHLPALSIDFISPATPFLMLRHDGSPLISDTATIDGRIRNFVPDGVFSIANIDQQKRLLFFLEVDMGTESVIRSNGKSDTISQKVMNYSSYYASDGYKRYQKKWGCELKGFRVLFVTKTSQRKETISRFLRESRTNGFVWVTDQTQMFQRGLGATIWARGGHSETSLHSIIGPTMAMEAPHLVNSD
jgi:hypothetical protein